MKENTNAIVKIKYSWRQTQQCVIVSAGINQIKYRWGGGGTRCTAVMNTVNLVWKRSWKGYELQKTWKHLKAWLAHVDRHGQNN